MRVLLAAIMMALVAQTGLFCYWLMVYPSIDAEGEIIVYRLTDTE